MILRGFPRFRQVYRELFGRCLTCGEKRLRGERCRTCASNARLGNEVRWMSEDQRPMPPEAA